MTTMDETAVYYHELYLSFIKAGFTQEQALSLVTASMVASVQVSAMWYRHG